MFPIWMWAARPGRAVPVQQPQAEPSIAIACPLLIVRWLYRVSVEQDHLRLLVYTSDLTAPYEKLGDLSYTDPLNGETIDSDHINEKLRQMAIARWGQQVDAIIHVSTKVGGADAQSISVTGEAVRLKGPCSGCRHDISSPPA